MISLIETKNLQLLNSVLRLEYNLGHTFILIIEGADIKGMFEIQPLTKICGMLHMHIKPEHQRKGLAEKAFLELIKYLKGSWCEQLIGSIPTNNKRIMSIVNKVKARACGIIKDGIIYEGALQDLLLFQYEV